MARSKLVEIFSRIIGVQDRKDKIYVNGSDNQYPERIERVINNSVTAKLSVDRFITYLVGLGFEEGINETIVNKRKNLTIYDILNRIAKDVAYQKGFYLHVNYDGLGNVNYLDVLKFKDCRVSEEDDFGYSGYIWHSKKWVEEGNLFSVLNKKQKNWYYPYNPNIEVINAQRRKDSGKNASPEDLVKGYRGQVLFVNLDADTVYPNSYIDPAYNDADTEHRISLFRNDRIKTGFLGANLVIIPEVADDKEWKQKQEEFKGLLGAENSSNIMVVEAKLDGDRKLSEYVHIETIKSEVNTEQFQYDEKMVQENILNCYRVPKMLVKSPEGALFGPNAESLRVNQSIFQEETEKERNEIENALKKVFKGHELEDKLKIVPLIKDNTNQNIEKDGSIVDK